MIIQTASASAYDDAEVHIGIKAEKDETISVGDIITIPMNNHTFKQREITAMYKDWKKWKKGKQRLFEIKDGEGAICIIHNIHPEEIHTISSPYDEELLENNWVSG